MRKYLLIILYLWSFATFGTNYYVSNSGSDAASGLTGNPWQTLSHVNDKIADNTIQSGDIIYLNKGDVFVDTLIISKGITIDSYGSGDSPEINNLTTISSWGNTGNKYYVELTYDVKSLLFDGTPLSRGIYTENPIWASDDNRLTTIDKTDVSNVIATSTVIGNCPYDLTGSYMVCEINGWTFANYLVKYHGNDTVIIDATYSNSYLSAGVYGDYHGFHNSKEIISNTGDWAFQDDTLWVYSSDAISNHIIQVPSVSSAIRLSGSEDVTIQNIDIFGANDTIIKADFSGNLYLENISTGYGAMFCSGFASGDNITAENVDFNWVYHNAFRPEGGNLDTLIVSGCDINYQGYLRGYYIAEISAFNGMFATGDMVSLAQFSNNIVNYAGYNIVTSSTAKTIVNNNYIYKICELLNDGGLHIGDVTGGRTDTVYIYDNVIISSGRGIYQDFGGTNFQIYNNYVDSCDYGYYTNDGKYTDVYNNIFKNNQYSIRTVQWSDSTTLGYLNDLKIYDNVSINPSYANFMYTFGSVSLPDDNWSTVDFGILDTNKYYQPTDENDFFLNVTSHAFTEYQAKGYEPNSTYTVGETDFDIRYNTTRIPITLSNDSIYTDVFGNVEVGGSIELGENKMFISISKYTAPQINSILGGYYGGYLNGGYYGGSIIGTKQ